ncbi:MAG: glycoside hydrolase [Sphingobacteriaceae bacterium]|nr:glycoside hydrolase [Sphingobacteriaceae bacterium]
MKRRTFLRDTLLTSTGIALIPTIVRGETNLFSLNTQNQLLASVNAAAPGQKFEHFWSKCVGAGRANEGLRASWLEQMKLSKDLCGFQYCRFHGLFHNDMFVYREANGKPVFNWQYVDDLFDRMLAIGVKPFVELAFMPKDLASDETSLQFWWKGQTSPPKDYAKWGELVSEFTKHCIARYGLPEVKTWYFEVWNEPNLKAFWNGTKSQYFELYKSSAMAIKAIDKSLRVGGPATSNFVPDDRFDGEIEDKTKHKTHTVKDLNTLEWKGVWIKDFINYCSKENLPLDFISTHPYPTDWALDPGTKKGGQGVRKVDATKEDLTWLKNTIAQSPYPKAEIHLTEWSSSPSPRDPAHDSLQAAAFIIKTNLDSIGIVDSLAYWTFTDVFEEGGAGNSIFHGGFGLINYQGIVKPSFHGYRMLNALGDEILKREDGLIVTRNSKTKKISALIYHYPQEMKNTIGGKSVEIELNTGTPKKVSLSLSGLKISAGVTAEFLNIDSGFAYPLWKKMGSPEPPSREQTKQLKQTAMNLKQEKFKADIKGNLKFEKKLDPWTCVLIREV